MSTPEEVFNKAKESLKKVSVTVPYGDLTKKTMFELAYHCSNDVTLKLVKVDVKADENEPGTSAVLHSPVEKFYIEITAEPDALAISIYADSELGEKLNSIKECLSQRVEQFKNRSEDMQKQIKNAILVERKMDEVIDLVSRKEITRQVYLAIGETRERSAVIPFVTRAPKADVALLAMMKWMNIASKEDEDKPFPEAKGKGLIKNYLKLKEWMLNIINRAFTLPEEELLKEESVVEE